MFCVNKKLDIKINLEFKDFVCLLIIKILIIINFRIGNDYYVDENNIYGLIILLKKYIKFELFKIILFYIGKKYV